MWARPLQYTGKTHREFVDYIRQRHPHLGKRKSNWSTPKLAKYFRKKYDAEYARWRAARRIITGEK